MSTQKTKVLIIMIFVVLNIMLSSYIEVKVSGSRSRIIYIPDDYPSIRSAISNTSGDITLYLRSGIYTEEQYIEIENRNITIKGLGQVTIKASFKIRGSTLTIMNAKIVSGYGSSRYLFRASYSNITLINVSISKESSVQYALKLSFTNLTLKNTLIENTGAYAVYISSGNLVMISTRIRGAYEKAVSQSAGNVEIRSSEVDGPAIGFYIRSGNTAILENVIISNCSDKAVRAGSFDNLIIRDSYINNCNIGIEIVSIDNTSIKNVNIYNTNTSLLIDTSNVLMDNVKLYNSSYGILVSSTIHNVNITNSIIQKQGYGLYVSSSAYEIIVSNTSFIECNNGIYTHYVAQWGSYQLLGYYILFRDNDIAVKYHKTVKPIIIYFSKFINNNIDLEAFGNGDEAVLHYPERVHYRYRDRFGWNYLGNYYDKYTGKDVDGDGIGDTNIVYPYVYPLVGDPREYKIVRGVNISNMTIKIKPLNNTVSTVFLGSVIELNWLIINPNYANRSLYLIVEGQPTRGAKGATLHRNIYYYCKFSQIEHPTYADWCSVIIKKNLEKHTEFYNLGKNDTVLIVPPLSIVNYTLSIDTYRWIPRNYTLNITLIDLTNRTNKISYIVYVVNQTPITATTAPQTTTPQPPISYTTTTPSVTSGKTTNIGSEEKAGEEQGGTDFIWIIVLLVIIVIAIAAIIIRRK